MSGPRWAGPASCRHDDSSSSSSSSGARPPCSHRKGSKAALKVVKAMLVVRQALVMRRAGRGGVQVKCRLLQRGRRRRRTWHVCARQGHSRKTGLDLTDLDLTGLDLADMDLTDLDLTGLDLADMDLTDLDLTGLDLTESCRRTRTHCRPQQAADDGLGAGGCSFR